MTNQIYLKFIILHAFLFHRGLHLMMSFSTFHKLESMMDFTAISHLSPATDFNKVPTIKTTDFFRS